MKPINVLFLLAITGAVILCAGCTGTPPAATPSVPTTQAGQVPSATLAPSVAPSATPYPGALALGAPAPFGIGGKNGTATVYRPDLRSDYTWTSSSFNSPREQRLAGEPLGTQYDYNTEKPAEGNTFLFVWVRLTDIGSGSIVAPSPGQFTVNYQGKDYPYRSLAGPDVTINGIRSMQYDYQIGPGGVAGYILPGESNAVDGFLIYEVPASIDLTRAYMVITLDPEHTAAWQLA